MRYVYTVDVSDDSVVVNGREYKRNLWDTNTAIVTAIINYMTDSGLKDGVYNNAVYWPDSIDSMLTKMMTKRYSVEATEHYMENAVCYICRLAYIKRRYTARLLRSRWLVGRLLRL